MLFWSLIIVIAAISCAALFYAWRVRPVNASAQEALHTHHSALLSEIDSDLALGRLSDREAEAARAELARELIRQQDQQNTENAPAGKAVGSMDKVIIPAGLVMILLLSGVIYFWLGSPDQPAAPLSARADVQQQDEIVDAVERVEAQLAANPDDVRGWQAIAPVYMRMQRYRDAVRAFRRILELAPVTPDAQTNLAEALMLANQGDATGEPLQLLQSAADSEPAHVRSRFYLAGEATRVGDYQKAITLWNQLLALGKGDEPWMDTARNGLAFAETELKKTQTEPTDATSADQQEMIRGMVDGLASRLANEGGSVDEWTRLVRSYLVLGQSDDAQTAHDSALAAYPDAMGREALDALAAENGLN